MQDSIRELWRSEFPMENVIQFTAGIQELALVLKHLFAEIREGGVESVINGHSEATGIWVPAGSHIPSYSTLACSYVCLRE